MNYLILLDHQLKKIFSCGQEHGQCVPQHLTTGNYLWDSCYPPDAEKTKHICVTAYEAKRTTMYIGSWANPCDPIVRSLYAITAHWIGIPAIAVALSSIELPGELGFLSDREKEILLDLGSGRAAPEIARQAGIAESTIRTHMQRMKTKLNVGSNDDLTVIGARVIQAHHGKRPRPFVTEGWLPFPIE